MNYIKENKAFTIVELIVVILVLAVLSTISFLGLKWYSEASRDWVRISDIKTIEKLLEFNKIENWSYPQPLSWTDITYSGSTIWTQWTFSQKNSTKSVNKNLIDPQTGKLYAYSITKNTKEFQLATILEEKWPNTIGTENNDIFVSWNYNGKAVVAIVNDRDYILWVPSIITSDISNTDIWNIIDNNKLVYSWYNNLPASYTWSTYNTDGGFNYSPNKLLLFEWDISDLESNWEARKIFFNTLKVNYSWSTIQKESNIVNMMWLSEEDDLEIAEYVSLVLNLDIRDNNKNIIDYNWDIDEHNWDIDDFILTASGTYVEKLYSNSMSYAAIKNDNSLITWWNETYWGISPSLLLKDIKEVYAWNLTYLALRNDGTVVAWWKDVFQSDSDNILSWISNIDSITNMVYGWSRSDNYILHASNWENILVGSARDLEWFDTIEPQLTNIKSYYFNWAAVVALKNDGIVVAWWNSSRGWNISWLGDKNNNIKEIYPSRYAFVAVKNDNTWLNLGSSSIDSDYLMTANIKDIFTYSNDSYYAVREQDNSVKFFSKHWGDEIINMVNIDKAYWGTKNFYWINTDWEILWYWPTAKTSDLAPTWTGFIDIYYSDLAAFTAFVTLKEDGTVVHWWNNRYWWLPDDLPVWINNVSKLYYTWDATVALKTDGTIAYWYGARTWEIPDVMIPELYDITDIYMSPPFWWIRMTVAAIRSDNSVFVWWNYSVWWDSTSLDLTNVKQIIQNKASTTVLKYDWEIMSWWQSSMWWDIPSLTYEEFRKLNDNP